MPTPPAAATGSVDSPRPSDLRHLRPSIAAGAIAVATVGVTTTAGISLSLQAPAVVWLAGQIVLGFALVQWFVLLHECGHETLFGSRRWDRTLGHVAGFFSIVPFACWTRVHGRHHRWTGWQDLDPTTEALVPRARGRFEQIAVNVCWKLWIPLFATVYRIGNYWHVPRLFRLFVEREARAQIVRGTLALAACYGAIAAILGPWGVCRLAGLAVTLSFMIEEVLLLSQHTHVPQHVSGGRPVRPFSSIEQSVFTRSLRLPRWISMMLLHFDAHELHHMYPFVPGYRLAEIAHRPGNDVAWWKWTIEAHRLRGDVFFFQNRLQSGWDL
jgi:acyl-lipid omega-6 desaturase (Delta-12 desaturase)